MNLIEATAYISSHMLTAYNTTTFFAIIILLVISYIMLLQKPQSLTSIPWLSTRIPNGESELATHSSFSPRFFPGYEVSPNKERAMGASGSVELNKGRTSGTHEDDVVVTETMIPFKKTVYLIRHAESDENRRLASLGRSLKGLTKLNLPTKDDVSASIELLDVKAQIDSDVSQVGRKQINQLGERLRRDSFLKSKGIQLVAHSPLKRARQTAEGMLGCVTPRSDVPEAEDSSATGHKADGIERVVELPFLAERTPMEWLPINHDAYTKRIALFEKWLGEQPEDVIAVVGHSQYFKNMLGMSYKFGNCDVWEVQFDNSVSLSHKSVKKDINIAERSEQERKLKEKLNKSLAFAKKFNKDDEREEKKEDSSQADPVLRVPSENEQTKKYKSVSTEEMDLPRGWSKLRNLYTYDSRKG